jgi:hypothetical protein
MVLDACLSDTDKERAYDDVAVRGIVDFVWKERQSLRSGKKQSRKERKRCVTAAKTDHFGPSDLTVRADGWICIIAIDIIGRGLDMDFHSLPEVWLPKRAQTIKASHIHIVAVSTLSCRVSNTGSNGCLARTTTITLITNDLPMTRCKSHTFCLFGGPSCQLQQLK